MIFWLYIFPALFIIGTMISLSDRDMDFILKLVSMQHPEDVAKIKGLDFLTLRRYIMFLGLIPLLNIMVFCACLKMFILILHK